MTRRKTFTLIALAGIALLGMQTLQAQLTTATISGTVADTTGAVIPGVSVSVLQVETGTSRDAVTDDEGRYRVPLLDPGEYEVQAELTGFRTAVRAGITLTVGDRIVVDLTLSVGEISERVVVEGEAPLVQTTDTTLSGLVDTKKIRDLPFRGSPYNIHVDGDDYVWPACFDRDSFIRFDPDTKTMLEYPLPGSGVITRDIWADEQGRMWFAQNGLNKISSAEYVL